MLDYSDIEIMIRNRSFPEFLDSIDFMEYYTENILPRKGGGIDRISPRTYQKTFGKDIERIKDRCKNGSYEFSPYNEKLILKGRNKYPRVISIPTVRDRFVLSVLNSHLRTKLDIHRKTANSYIKTVKDFIGEHDNLFFFKTDITSFFDNIRHDVLLRKLSGEVDDACLQLVSRAIKTATCEPGHRTAKSNCVGVPQGISIATTLSEKYMQSFDARVNTQADAHSGLYIRYVDDILILSPVEIHWQQILEAIIKDEQLGLVLSADKTKCGRLDRNCVDYLGYTISSGRIGIRLANQRTFSDRIAGRCHQFVKQLNNPNLRPKYLISDTSFLEYSLMDINLLISGFRAGSHNYGWLPYFQQITDLKILYQLDNVVSRICHESPIADRLNSFVKTYHALRHRSGIPYVVDFDKVESTEDKACILRKMGRISLSDNLTDTAVSHIFDVLLDDLTRNSQKDMRELS